MSDNRIMVEWQGATRCLKEWAQHFGVNYRTFYCRYKRYGMAEAVAMNDPKNKHYKGNVVPPRTHTFDGKTMTLAQWADHLGVTKTCLANRLCRHPIAVAFTMTAKVPKVIVWRGEAKTIREWAASIGVDYKTLHARLKNHPMEVAMAMPDQSKARRAMRRISHPVHGWLPPQREVRP